MIQSWVLPEPRPSASTVRRNSVGAAPVIVDCGVYRDGQRVDADLALDEAFELAGHDDAFVWVGLHNPSSDEFDDAARRFHLHELAVEEAIKAHQRPKLEVYGASMFVVTVRHGDLVSLAPVRRRLEDDTALLGRGPVAVLYAVLDLVVDEYPARESRASRHSSDADARRISALVAIAAVPTMIAGVDGMNFTHMPELDWAWGYPIALLAMAGICVGLYLGFRRNGWL